MSLELKWLREEKKHITAIFPPQLFSCHVQKLAVEQNVSDEATKASRETKRPTSQIMQGWQLHSGPSK